MTTYDSPPGEMLSALFDGQPGAQAALANLHTAAQADLRSNWNAYQLIGESLRASSANLTSAAAWGADPAFLQRVSAQLVHETIEKPATQLAPSKSDAIISMPIAAANDGQFRWKLVAGFASLAAVMAVAWSVVGNTPASSAPQLAQGGAGQTLVTATTEGLMIRDPRLEELLSAHKQLGATTLQVPSGFVRNAGFETSGQPGR
jgi:sigma-E factor negative regulatory protein RseA